MIKYQLADGVKGVFGDIYDTRAAAEAALDKLVSDLFEAQQGVILIEESLAARREGRAPRPFSDEELAVIADARLRGPITIVATA